MSLEVKFLIVGTYRTGSSALVQSLNCHPEIVCGFEWTQRLLPKRALTIAERFLAGDVTALRPKHQEIMRSILSPSYTALGFKRLFRASNKWLFSPAFGPLLVDGLERHLRWLEEHPDIRVIHVVRNDNLAWLRSKAFADATGAYTGKSYPENMELHIPPSEAVRRVRAKLRIDDRLSSLARTNPYLRVDYESFAADNYNHTREMVEFLGCDSSQLDEVDLTKHIQSRSTHRITNAEELKSLLAEFSTSRSENSI